MILLQCKFFEESGLERRYLDHYVPNQRHRLAGIFQRSHMSKRQPASYIIHLLSPCRKRYVRKKSPKQRAITPGCKCGSVAACNLTHQPHQRQHPLLSIFLLMRPFCRIFLSQQHPRYLPNYPQYLNNNKIIIELHNKLV